LPPPETGTTEANKALAQARAQSVADGLVAAGVQQARIRIEPWGALTYGLTPIESRRVEIIVGVVSGKFCKTI
jgi:outer membrane protein OmpA-like peptidoglycan-associated protein